MQVLTVPDISAINDFLYCPTPNEWLEKALDNIPVLLLDHAHAERKAANTALSLIYRYPQHQSLCMMLSKLAREELLHFEKVLQVMKKKNITLCHLDACDYAKTLHQNTSKNEPERLRDLLIIASIIEARSCERFAGLIPLLENDLAMFYLSLVKSEARHFEDYLHFARTLSNDNINSRVDYFLHLEGQLVQKKDTVFRFHSGV